MTVRQFLTEVRYLRAAQIHFFRSRFMKDLKESKKAEIVVDNIVTENKKYFIDSADCLSLWIARDQDGSLFAYQQKPVKVEENDRAFCPAGGCGYMRLPETMFPDIKWEDGPQQINLIRYD